MIRKASSEDWEQIFEYVSQDFARNYFIGLGMLRGPETFKDIYIDEEDDIRAILFHRASNNLQFVAYDDYDIDGMQTLLKSLDFDTLISPKSYCEALHNVLTVKKEGAIISKITEEDFINIDIKHHSNRLLVKDVYDVEALYKTVFPGYPKAPFMIEKLLSHRGIGYFIKEGDIVSVAQSEFGYVIVGVATSSDYQGQGYATSCLIPLMIESFKHHETLYLQYDNKAAGRLYIQLGFKPVDQVYHYIKE